MTHPKNESKNYHQVQTNYERALHRLNPEKYPFHYDREPQGKPFNLLPKNRERIDQFIQYMESQNLCGKDRIILKILSLAQLSEMLNMEYDSATQSDIRQLVSDIQRKEWENETKFMRITNLKQFYRWLNVEKARESGIKAENLPDIDEDPVETKWIKFKREAKKKIKLPKDIPTEEDVKKLLDHARDTLERCLIITLYETGCRVGELGTCNINNLEFNPEKKGEAHLSVSGKTGDRKILMVASVPYLLQYLRERTDSIPGRAFDENNPTHHLSPNAPLFVCRGKTTRGKRYSYHAFIKMLSTIGDRAGIRKRCNPHAFRHARASKLAEYLTDSQLNQVMGWVQGGGMARIYVHLSGTNTDNAIKRNVYGQHIEETRESTINAPKCEICNTINEVGKEFCGKCFNPLTIKARLTQSNAIDELRKELEQVKKERDAYLLVIKTLGIKSDDVSPQQAKTIFETLHSNKGEIEID